MFRKKRGIKRGREAVIVSGLVDYSLEDTLTCGQAFRYEELIREDNYVEYMTVVGDELIFIGQDDPDELAFYSVSDEVFEAVVLPYFALDTDYGAIREDITSRTDSEWLKAAAEAAKGVRILRQEPWEALLSFIISQNNNIPRIRKIIRSVCSEYGRNLAESSGLSSCPVKGGAPIPEECKKCGICYTFPTPKDLLERPEGLLPSHPGFRYKYMLDAAERVASGRTDISDISSKNSYDHTVTELKKILGVGDKVASCAALFGFGNLEAFPIDVWMKRAIDEYFGGSLDHEALGKYRGVAQQYIFHYIRNLDGANGEK